ncbi:MAG: sodium:solute symporter family protein [Gemmatimonadaceae bacterium]
MTLHLPLLLAYSVLLVGIGLWIGRRVTTADTFFVAGRGLGPGLLFATLIAANIGAGSTVGAAGLGYTDGLAAWWWVGAAAIGSMVQAFWIGPRMRRLAAERGLRTVGDYLEYRFGPSVRVVVGVLLWLGTLTILAGQLIAMSTLFTAMMGSPKWLGCIVGGVVVTAYFSAGGLLSSAWVNVVQVIVKFAGFALAFPAALMALGGWDRVRSALPADPGYWSPWQNGPSGWVYLALLGPAFIVSPGLLQKIFGAKDDRTVRIGVGANALVLLLFAAVPPLLGMMARAAHPDLPEAQLALPTLLVQDVPVAIGALGLAALFSAEVSSADAILFMLSTSLSQDLYRRTVNPAATDAQVLRVARMAALTGGMLGIGIALVAQTIVGALSFFYSVLGVCLFVPLVGGLSVGRLGRREALAAIIGGSLTMLALQLGVWEARPVRFSPAFGGMLVSLLAAGATAFVFRERRSV